jgi:hypothetical protein
VRAAVAAADRHRRRRAASARVWQIAPLVTGLALGVAAVGYWVGWPDAVPLGLLAAACLAGVLQWTLVRRDRAVSDAVAAAIDAEAGLRGELRSASWFAGRGELDEWAALHLDRAADRLQTLDWAQLYRPVRATRSRLATLVMVAATLAIAIALPDRVGAGRDLSALDSRRGDRRLGPSEMQAIPPELLKQIQELLAAAEAGTLASRLNEGSRSAADMQELLERLRELRDTEALKELARAMDPDKTDMTAEALNALAERVKRAADMTASERAAREALEDLARNLNKAAEAEGLNERAEQTASSETPENAGERTAAPGQQEMSQAVNEAQSAAGGAGVVMMSDQNAAGSASSPGFGLGGSGAMPTASEMAALDSALRQELVEASRDSGGSNVEAEIRRKTEQGAASVAFTHSASGPSDVSRAATPPAVPEARRTDVQRYFIRKQ